MREESLTDAKLRTLERTLRRLILRELLAAIKPRAAPGTVRHDRVYRPARRVLRNGLRRRRWGSGHTSRREMPPRRAEDSGRSAPHLHVVR